MRSLAAVWMTMAMASGPVGNAEEPGKRPVVVAFGDSTTARRKGIEEVYEQRLARLLPDLQVINAGVPGDTTERARARFARDVLAQRPRLAILQFGANDSAVDVWKGATEPRVRAERYEENLRFFLAELRQRDCRVILMTPGMFRWTAKLRDMYGKPPYRPDEPDGFCATLRAYAEIVRRVAKEEKVLLVDAFAAHEAYDARAGQSADDLFLDGMHPNDRGHELAARLLLPAVRQAMGRLAPP